MGNKPLVSVIIPCYNHESYILDCLNSIYNCSYTNLELIVIDDGSKDSSYEIAANWISNNSERFKRTYLHKQSNFGICRTMNLLISFTQGEYIFAIASDDRVTKNGIVESYLALEKSSKDILITDISLIDENGLLVSNSAFNYFSRPVNQYNWSWLFYTDLIVNWNPPFQHYMIKKDYYIKYGTYNENLSFEDRDFILNAILNKKLTYCKCIAKEYRIRLSNRLTPGLNQNNLQAEFQAITKRYSNKFNGYLKILLIILSLANEKNIKIIGLINKIFAKTALNIIRYFVKIIYYVSNYNAKTNSK